MANMLTDGAAQNETFESDIEQELPRTYRDLLRATKFTHEQINSVHKVRNGRAVMEFAGALITTAAVPVLYAAAPHPVTFIVCILLTIHNFNSFAQIVHGSDHGKLVVPSWWNDVIGGIAAGFLGFTRAGHAISHHIHHTKLNTPEDSDRIWGHPEQSTQEIFRMWLRDICLISAVRRLLQYTQFDRSRYEVAPWRGMSRGFFSPGKVKQLLPVLAIQTAVIILYAAIVGPQYYIYFYVLPIMTIYPAQIRLRTACEHSFDAGYKPNSIEERWVSRSIRANFLERLIIAPLGIEYHFEHHLLPGVPHYNLPQVRHLLASKGFNVPIAPGYFAYIFKRWRQEQELIAA